MASIVIHTLNKGGELAGGAGARYDADVIAILKNSDETATSGFEPKILDFMKNRDGEGGLGSVRLLKHENWPRFESAAARGVDMRSNGRVNLEHV